MAPPGHPSTRSSPSSIALPVRRGSRASYVPRRPRASRWACTSDRSTAPLSCRTRSEPPELPGPIPNHPRCHEFIADIQRWREPVRRVLHDPDVRSDRIGQRRENLSKSGPSRSRWTTRTLKPTPSRHPASCPAPPAHRQRRVRRSRATARPPAPRPSPKPTRAPTQHRGRRPMSRPNPVAAGLQPVCNTRFRSSPHARCVSDRVQQSGPAPAGPS